jgi:superfamily II DNA helicase RecQ
MAEGDLEPGDSFSWSELRQMARQRFGIERFRPGQRELISSALAGRDALGILPTGAGKSLCYQLPALLLKGTVVVVSPLIGALTALRAGSKRQTLQQLAEVAGFTPRRTQVIVAVLENMDLVRRSGRGLLLRRGFTDPELEAFLATFEARQAMDRERISLMMQYGQTTRCRMQFLREYFGDPASDACGHCDNCERPPPVEAAGQQTATNRRAAPKM